MKETVRSWFFDIVAFVFGSALVAAYLAVSLLLVPAARRSQLALVANLNRAGFAGG